MKEDATPIHILFKSPKPLGYCILYAQATPHIRFTMLYKPSWLQRWFTNKLLGWTWKDEK